MRVGVAGVGKWGINLVRVLKDLDVEVETFDPVAESTTETFKELVGSVDKVMVASPPWEHFEQARIVVETGKPLFVEKPVCFTSWQAHYLKTHQKTQVHVGHILTTTRGFVREKEKRPRHFQAWRASHNPGYHNLNALWDIGVHDVAAAVNLFGKPDHVEGAVTEETYKLWLNFTANRTAVIEGSRVADGKQWIVQFDDRKYTPYSEKTEPLLQEVEAFLDGYDNLDEAATVVDVLNSV